MKLAKYIGDLLFEYECIVIPGFGGFITKSISAEIQPIQNHFIPAKKEIVFNAHLKTNDGLLINHVARAESLSYTDARLAVERFVKRCKEELGNGKRIRFQKVGLIYLGVENTIQFEPDTSQNYLADSYGLTSFISPAIKRTGSRPLAQKTINKDRNAKYVVREEAKKQHTPKYIRINVSLIVIVLAMASIIYFKFGDVKEYAQNYSSVIPFLDSTKNKNIIADNTNKINEPVAKVITLVDRLNPNKGGKKLPDSKRFIKNSSGTTNPQPVDKTDHTPGIKSPTKNDIKMTPSKKAGDTEKIIEDQKTSAEGGMIASADPHFYIIAGSFGNKLNAEKMMMMLREKGFQSSVVGMTNNGSYRVALAGFSTIEAANKQLAIVRKEDLSSAWILPN